MRCIPDRREKSLSARTVKAIFVHHKPITSASGRWCFRLPLDQRTHPSPRPSFGRVSSSRRLPRRGRHWGVSAGLRRFQKRLFVFPSLRSERSVASVFA